ncbi:MAG: flagellar biosynthesis anti-sigma factor FlgM [Chloroflexi bacterium]|nr:MAG: flagellar biosynthesis anti-sigma factor FlgM [Chloroflexota bacterium]
MAADTDYNQVRTYFRRQYPGTRPAHYDAPRRIPQLMNLERLGAHEAARAYVQQTEVNRSAAPARPENADKSRTRANSRRDTVTLSDNARVLASAREVVQQAPDVREQKVADIKQRVADGTYSVPSHVLARKMLTTEQN